MTSDDWQSLTLGEFVRLQRGHDLTEAERRPGAVPVFGSAGHNGNHDTALARGPGVVIGRSGDSMGVVSYTPTDFWPHNTVLYVTDFLGNSPRFAYYFLGWLRLRRFDSGSAQASLNRNFVYPIPIKIPRRDEQERIVALLGALDDKIELNRRMNETLEAMARAIFQDWFVAFGPTRAKMEGRPPYLAPDLWSLFPDSLDADGKPEGWAAGPLSSLAVLGREIVTPASFPEELFDHYSIPAFDAGREPVRESGAGILSNKTLVTPDAVLLSKLNPDIPRVWLVDTDAGVRSICSTEFLVLSPLVETNRALLYCTLADPGFKQRLEAQVTGTSKSHQRVKPQSVLSTEIMLAEPVITAAFGEIAKPLLDRALANLRESRTLAATRDLLLPRLMSGALRVKDAEHAVETNA
jgi:type I restriction enzyme S subunit